MLLVLFAAEMLSATATLAARPTCSLTASDKAANARMSFEDFDQKGTAPTTFRALSDHGCMREAAEAAEDYLLHGPARTDPQQRIIVWHLAQSLALAGDERQAAFIMAGTRVPADDQQGIDWDDYVVASWAFLAKERAAFETAATRLGRSTRAPDRINSAIVSALGRCWNQPYRIAYNPTCGM